MQASASAPELKSKIEGSPLLVGVQYMGSSEHASWEFFMLSQFLIINVIRLSFLGVHFTVFHYVV